MSNNNDIISIIDSMNDHSNGNCPLRGSKASKAVCSNCKYSKNDKCTFDIWKWKGIGN